MANDEVTLLPRIELPVEAGTYDLSLNYNGEIAFNLRIVNHDDELKGDPKKQVSSTVELTTWPINGGMGETANVTLFMEGHKE
jgi:hypothetical protein